MGLQPWSAQKILYSPLVFVFFLQCNFVFSPFSSLWPIVYLTSSISLRYLNFHFTILRICLSASLIAVSLHLTLYLIIARWINGMFFSWCLTEVYQRRWGCNGRDKHNSFMFFSIKIFISLSWYFPSYHPPLHRLRQCKSLAVNWWIVSTIFMSNSR